MRLLLASALLLALVPAASAQGTPTLTLEVKVPEAPVDPGDEIAVSVVMQRHCANPVTVLDEQPVTVAIESGTPADPKLPSWTLQTPVEAVFAQQVCATQQSQEVTVLIPMTANADIGRGEQHPLVAHVVAEETSPLTPGMEIDQPFFLLTTEAPPPAPVVEQPEKESPGLGAVASLLVLLAAVLALSWRRR